MPIVFDPGDVPVALPALLPESAGPIYYVDLTDGDNHNSGTDPAAPWRTVDGWDFGAGGSVFHGRDGTPPSPGDRFYVTGVETQAGLTLADYLDASGTATAPITIQRWPGRPRPVWKTVGETFKLGDPQAAARTPGYYRLIELEFACVDAEGGDRFQVWIGCTGVDVLSCRFLQNNDQLEIYSPSNLVNVVGCLFAPSADLDLHLHGSTVPGIDLFGDGSADPVTGKAIPQDIAIYNNLFNGRSSAGVALYVVDRALVVFNTLNEVGNDTDFGIPGTAAVYLSPQFHGGGPVANPRNVRIAFNIMANVDGAGIMADAGGSDPTGDWGNRSHDNLYYNTVRGPLEIQDDSMLVDLGGNLAADPRFVHEGNAHLRRGSPAIGRLPSAYLGALRPTRDYDGVLRVNPTALGAFEYVAVRKLDCGTYEAGIFLRGGKRLLGLVPWTHVSWERVLNLTSQAELSLEGVSGHGLACCGVIGESKPWKHELHLFRNNLRVWSGPLVRKEVEDDDALLVARDLTAWWWKRRIHHNHDFSGNPSSDAVGEFPDLATMFRIYAEDAMEPDNSPGLCLQVADTGIRAERNVLARSHQTAGAILDELTRAGIDWTAVDRDVLAGGRIPVDPLPTLVDDSFMVAPKVVLDGTQQENASGVRGAGTGPNGDALWAEARDADAIGEYGLLEGTASEAGLEDRTAVRAAAASRNAALAEPVASIESGQLDPETSIPIYRLVPGARVPVRLLKTCETVSDVYRLAKVAVQASASSEGGEEQVTVTFQPLGSTTDEEA